MNGFTLLRKLRRRATRKGVDHSEKPGKGDHVKVQHGGLRTVVPAHRKDLKIGTFHAILRDLGLTPADLED